MPQALAHPKQEDAVMYLEVHPDILLEVIKAEQRVLWKEAERQALVKRARAVTPRPSPPGRSMRTPLPSFSVLSVRSAVTSHTLSKPRTNALSS